MQNKNRMQIEEFLPLYLKAAAEGLTKEEFAEQIGVKPATVYQRVYELRRNVDPTIPLLVSGTKKSLAERAKAVLDKHQGNGADQAKPEPKSRAKKEPVKESQDLSDAEKQALDEIFG